jgi:hypothetical protein
MPADTCTSVDFLILSPFAPLHRNYRQDERLAGDRDCVECINVKHTSRASNAEKQPPGHGPEGYDENEPAAVRQLPGGPFSSQRKPRYLWDRTQVWCVRDNCSVV